MPDHRTIELFFDIGSPYSYLCATQIDAVAAKHDARVAWRPFLLGGVFKAAGNEMPARIPSKARWMLSDLVLWAKHYNVPFVFPPSFPPNTVKAMRACVAAADRGKTRELAMALFEGYWVHGVDPSSDAGLRAACAAAGLEADEILQAIDTQPIKDALRASTEEAVARGAFGAPTMFIGDQMLWGNDRLPMVGILIERAAADRI